jgi:hypothetical protein
MYPPAAHSKVMSLFILSGTDHVHPLHHTSASPLNQCYMITMEKKKEKTTFGILDAEIHWFKPDMLRKSYKLKFIPITTDGGEQS